MTVGKDVSALFPDVANCMQTDNLELKKLVYLYLMNYAKSQPDMAIMAVNTFVKDCEDPNPLIRALAVRTMGCIRVEKITEYLCEPLRYSIVPYQEWTGRPPITCPSSIQEMPQRRGPLRSKDRGRLRGQASRHQRQLGRGAGISRQSQRSSERLQPHGGGQCRGGALR